MPLKLDEVSFLGDEKGEFLPDAAPAGDAAAGPEPPRTGCPGNGIKPRFRQSEVPDPHLSGCLCALGASAGASRSSFVPLGLKEIIK